MREDSLSRAWKTDAPATDPALVDQSLAGRKTDLSPRNRGLAITMISMNGPRKSPHPRMMQLILLALLMACMGAPSAVAQEADEPPAAVDLPPTLRDTILPRAPGEEQRSPMEIMRELPRLGADLFRIARERVATVDPDAAERVTPASPPVPASYLLGPGDALSLMVFVRGFEQIAQEMTITHDGLIFPDQIGQVVAAGQTLEQLRTTLSQRYARIFAEPAVTLRISAQRTIEVYVTGDVAAPGRYLLTGMVTALDALYSAGGPSEIGSYRRIRLSRVGAEPRVIDLYDYLLTGSRENDLLLDPGDTIFVPPMGAEAGVAGEVRRPARYELDEAATVACLVEMSGGLTPQAHRVLHLWRTDEREQWRMIAIDTTDPSLNGMAMAVRDGDLLVARGIRDTFGNTVRILGAVQRPGYYPVERYPTVSSLIEAAEGLSVEAHVGRGVISRLDAQRHFEIVSFEVARALQGDPEHDLQLRAKDYVTIYHQEEVEEPFIVEIEGAVRRPGDYRWAANLRISQLVLRAGGLAPEAWTGRADLLRLTPEQTYKIIPVDLQAALREEAGADIVLQRGDRLQVMTRADVGMVGRAHIAGSVRNQGEYPRHAGMRVSDLIIAAGGLLPGAGPSVELTPGRFEGRPTPVQLILTGEAENFRVEPDLVLGDDDSVTITGRGDFKRRADVVFLRGQVERPGAFPMTSGPGDDPFTVWDLLEQGGGLLGDANESGIVVYRQRAAAMGDAQEEDLSRVLQSVNREAYDEVSTQVPEDQQPLAMQRTVTHQLRQVLTTPSSVSIVLPPHPVRQEDWVSAIPVEGETLIASRGEQKNLMLEPGDTVVVPRRPTTVMVLGAVPRSGAVPYVQSQTSSYYINESGGFRDDSARDRMIVIHANGSVAPINSETVLKPGDVVVVPTRHVVRTVRTESELQTWLRAIVPLVTAALIF